MLYLKHYSPYLYKKLYFKNIHELKCFIGKPHQAASLPLPDYQGHANYSLRHMRCFDIDIIKYTINLVKIITGQTCSKLLLNRCNRFCLCFHNIVALMSCSTSNLECWVFVLPLSFNLSGMFKPPARSQGSCQHSSLGL